MGGAHRLAWARRLLWPARPRQPGWEVRPVQGCGPVLCSGRLQGSHPLLFSLGFGASMYDYAPLAELFGQRQSVYRVAHRGSDRWAGLQAGARLLARRLFLAESSRQAAQAVRAHIHRPEARRRRLDHLWALASAVAPQGHLDLAGHSFGSDTALMLALEYGHRLRIGTLYLFSPHPPGYLIDASRYATLPVERVVVVVGSRDRTRDGVGPEQRVKAAEAVGAKAQVIVLEGVAHMDFAFADLGPPEWPGGLAQALDLGRGGRGCALRG